MKKIVVLTGILCLFMFLSSHAQTQSPLPSTVLLPTISLESTGQSITPEFFSDGFDGDYDSLPKLTLSTSSDLLTFHLPDPFSNFISINEEYYSHDTHTSCHILRNTYTLDCSYQNTAKLPISNRNNIQEDFAIYSLKSEPGQFIFKIILPATSIN